MQDYYETMFWFTVKNFCKYYDITLRQIANFRKRKSDRRHYKYMLFSAFKDSTYLCSDVFGIDIFFNNKIQLDSSQYREYYDMYVSDDDHKILVDKIKSDIGYKDIPATELVKPVELLAGYGEDWYHSAIYQSAMQAITKLFNIEDYEENTGIKQSYRLLIRNFHLLMFYDYTGRDRKLMKRRFGYSPHNKSRFIIKSHINRLETTPNYRFLYYTAVKMMQEEYRKKLKYTIQIKR